ncbi:MAG: serine/threonine protein kinase [Planctomycetes bacterium]|nr:serine/threonine protein kinase [Planctomycetota bacterium]
MPLRIGTHLGAYEILSLLGTGGMGEVYRARDSKLDRDVAVKVLPEALARDKERLLRFEREAKLLASLNHPHIAAIYGFEESDGKRFLVLELVEGDTLGGRLRNGPLPVDEALEVAKQIAEGLEAAHEKGIIHRDLKPANILVVEHGTGTGTAGESSGTGSTVDMIGQPKILDFGVARITDADIQAVTLQTEVGQIVGTLAYMSPEQVAGDSSKLDTRCDVYAIGVVLFELLTDRLPLDFHGKSVAEAARIIRDEDPAPAGTLDRDLRGDEAEGAAAHPAEAEVPDDVRLDAGLDRRLPADLRLAVRGRLRVPAPAPRARPRDPAPPRGDPGLGADVHPLPRCGDLGQVAGRRRRGRGASRARGADPRLPGGPGPTRDLARHRR